MSRSRYERTPFILGSRLTVAGQNMRKTGNTKSNAIYNPDPSLHPPPLNTDEGDSSMERHIRSKYEYQTFRKQHDHEPSSNSHASKPSSTSSSGASSFGASANSASPTATHFSSAAEPRSTKRSVSAGFGASRMGSMFSRSSSSPKENQVLGANPYAGSHGSSQRKKSVVAPAQFLHGMVTLSPEEKYEEQLKNLKDMGYRDVPQNIEVLQQTDGNILKTVEVLIRLNRNDKPPSPPKKDVFPSTSNVATPRNQPLDTSNPFEALDREEQQQRQQTPTLPVMSAHTTGSSAQYVNGNGYPQQQQPLQVHNTGYSLPVQQQYVQTNNTGYSLPVNTYAAQPQQPFNLAALTQALPASNPFSQQQQQQQHYAATAPTTPLNGVYSSNPFVTTQRTGPQQPAHQNCFQQQQQQQPPPPLQSHYTAQQPQIPQYAAPPQVQHPAAPPMQAQYTAQPQQYTTQNQYQLQPLQQQYTAQPQYCQQPIDKSSILALYNLPSLAPTPPQTQIPIAPAQTQAAPQPQLQPQQLAAGSRNPFAQKPKPVDDFGGRHSPDAFASLAFGVGG